MLTGMLIDGSTNRLFAIPVEQADPPVCIPTDGIVNPALIINEVMYNEAGSKGDEWVELFATTNIPSGAKFLISDNETASVLFRRLIEAPPGGIPTGSYIVIHDDDGVDDLDVSDGLIELWGAGAVGASSSSLRNSSDNLTLYRGDSEVGSNAIDYLRWGNANTDATNDDPPASVAWTGFAPGGAVNEQSIVRVVNGIDGSSGADWVKAGAEETIGPSTLGADNGGLPECRIELSLDKTLITPASGRAEPGEPLVYTLRVNNDGTSNVTEVTLKDRFDPNYLHYQTASILPDAQTIDTLTWTNSLQAQLPLAPGEAMTITVEFVALRGE